jgi:methylenetetrahydrofolate dehydrogenase (NADP+)/methenyltetrahydrofolate cyclohydrolase
MPETKIIDGKAYAAALRRRIATAVNRLQDDHRITPGLAVVLIGDDPASQIYVRNKGEQTIETGMKSFEHRLPTETDEDVLLTLVRGLNNNPDVHGILVQLPLPPRIRTSAVIDAIDPAKDVDGFHVVNSGHLATGGGAHALVPCTPQGCLLMIKEQLGDLSGKRALVLGRSNIVGKPVAALLLGEHCTVTIAHSRTLDLAGECRRADILVAAIGRPQMVKGDWIKEGATVIDVGINRIAVDDGEGGVKNRLVGDVDFEAAVKFAGAITPVPGGVGPMTIACLLRNTVIAACRQNNIEAPEL